LFSIFIRDIGVNLKSQEDVALVRFDSYADLLVPKNVQANEIETLDHLAEYVIKNSVYEFTKEENFDCIVRLIINVG
jgi:hypothetical protein